MSSTKDNSFAKPTLTGTTGTRGYGQSGYRGGRGSRGQRQDFYTHPRGGGSTRGTGTDMTDSSRSRGRFDHRGTATAVGSRGYGYAHRDDLPYWNCPDPDCAHRNPGRHYRCGLCSLCQPDEEDDK